MRSNPNCPLCNHAGRKQFDQLIYNGATCKQVKDVLSFQLERARNEYDQWMLSYAVKRNDESLKDADIAEKNRRLEDLANKEKLAEITLTQLEAHERHASFKPNHSFKLVELDDGDVLENCNFSQARPHTMIGEGVEGLVFKSCNLVNCDVPEDAKVEGSNNCQISFCAHLHPEWDLECEKMCSHVSKHVQELVMDGVVVAEEIVEYEDKVVD